MDKIKVIMVDDNIGLVEMVEEYFNESKSIKLVNKAYDGIEGIDLIEKERGRYNGRYAENLVGTGRVDYTPENA